MSTIRPLMIFALLLTSLLVTFPAEAQDEPCSIELQEAIAALEDAQRTADSGDDLRAVQSLTTVQQDLDAIIATCTESLYLGWEQFISTDQTLSFRYPEGWTVEQVSDQAVVVASSPDLTGSDISNIEGEQVVVIGIMDDRNLDDDMTDFEDVLDRVAEDFADSASDPIMREVGGRQSARFLVEEPDEGAMAVDVIDYLDLANPVVVVILTLGAPDEREVWLPLADLVGASIHYPVAEAPPATVEITMENIPGWRYALNRDTDTLIAYQLNGETHDILSSIARFQIIAGVGNDRVLMRSIDSEEEGVYFVTPEAALSVMDGFEEFATLDAQQGETLMLSTFSRPSSTGVFDVGTGQFSTLTGRTTDPICCALSDDGTLLRYVSTESAEDDPNITWALRERDLETGADRVVFVLDEWQGERFAVVMPDTHGERWLSQRGNRETRRFSTTLYGIDGTVQVLQDEPIEAISVWRFADDALYRYDPNCEANCTLELFATASAEPLQYDTPPSANTAILRQLPDNRLIVMIEAQSFYLISPDGEPLFLGPVSRMVFDNAISPDGRWAVLEDHEEFPDNYVVWNIEEERVIQTLPADEVGMLLQASYYDRGQIWHFSKDVTVLLDSNIGTVTRLPAAEERLYFEVLPDGSLLYLVEAMPDADNPGIYRLNPTNGESVPVLDGFYAPMVAPAGAR